MSKHKSFDLVTHRRDSKGKIIGLNPYRRFCRGSQVFYERPPGSGNFYWPDGSVKELAQEEVKKAVASKEVVDKASVLVAETVEEKLSTKLSTKNKKVVSDEPGIA